jgi:hypothetical protein
MGPAGRWGSVSGGMLAVVEATGWRGKADFSGIRSIYVLGEYILRKDFRMETKTKINTIAVTRDGTSAATMAGSDIEACGCWAMLAHGSRRGLAGRHSR